MPISSIVGAGMAAASAKPGKPNRTKPARRGARSRLRAKNIAFQNKFNSRVGSVSGSPTPTSTPTTPTSTAPTRSKYKADLSAWKPSKQARLSKRARFSKGAM